MVNDARALEGELRTYINDLVHHPLKRAGYRRSGRVWRSEGDGVVRVVDLQQELQSFVRDALASRSAGDHADDE